MGGESRGGEGPAAGGGILLQGLMGIDAPDLELIRPIIVSKVGIASSNLLS